MLTKSAALQLSLKPTSVIPAGKDWESQVVSL